MQAFTQGLWYDPSQSNILYESTGKKRVRDLSILSRLHEICLSDPFLSRCTGLYRRSSLRKVNLLTGEVLQQLSIGAISFQPPHHAHMPHSHIPHTCGWLPMPHRLLINLLCFLLTADPNIFAEGLTFFNDHFFQLTWKNE